MKHSESLANIGAALSKAQASVKIALKDSDNPHLRSKYADLGSVWDACREALSLNGLSVVQLPAKDEPGYIALETIILHSSGEYISETARTPAKDPKGQETAQSVGSAITYLRRYALSAALGIVADVDDDGHAASHGTGTQAPRGQQKPAQQQARPNTPPAAAQATLTPGQAQTLHKRLGAMLQDTPHRETTHNAFAALALGREVSSLTDLTPAEAKQVQEAAQKAQQAA